MEWGGNARTGFNLPPPPHCFATAIYNASGDPYSLQSTAATPADAVKRTELVFCAITQSPPPTDRPVRNPLPDLFFINLDYVHGKCRQIRPFFMTIRCSNPVPTHPHCTRSKCCVDEGRKIGQAHISNFRRSVAASFALFYLQTRVSRICAAHKTCSASNSPLLDCS